MSDSKETSPNDPIRMEAQHLLAEIKQFKEQAEERLKTTDSDLNSLAAHKQVFEELAAYIYTCKTAIETDLKSIGEFRKSIEQSSGDIDEIKQFRVHAEEQLKATAASRKKVDEDASYANQAKINTEEHLLC